jgi:hypothetical protein
MSIETNLTTLDPENGKTARMEVEDDLPRLGQFYWVKSVARWDTDEHKNGEEYQWLGCIMQIGSNFVELHSPKFNGSQSTIRVHLDEFDDVLTLEPNADQVIAEKVAFYQKNVRNLLGEITEVTKALGVVPQKQISDPLGEGNNSIAVVSSQVDTAAYKTALVKAKEKTLPDLFKQVEAANYKLAGWMTAPTLPMTAQIAPMKDSIGAIEDRVYTIELYAGLTEDAVKCCDGDPASREEPLHVMQRRLYMDEECLMNYTAGGMEFRNIREFDAWISIPENRDRILPFPRTLAAFRVRRDEKDREDGGNLLQVFVNIQLADADKRTFLYIRNGEQIWRIDANFVFDEMIFPDKSTFDPSEPMMVKMFGNRVDALMPVREYDFLNEAYKLHSAWMAEHDGKPVVDENGAVLPNRRYYSGNSPHYSTVRNFSPNEWKPFNDTNVYFDEANAKLSAEVKRYNRVATIIQGLFDRSLVLHPHPPVQIWTPSGFQTAVTLVYDASTLTHGEKPDFEAYRARVNASINENSIVTGQEDFWLLAMADKENERQDKDWRNRDRQRSNYVRYRPYENPGPGLVSAMAEWKPRVGKAVFRWEMERQDWRNMGGSKPKTITVPASSLFNIDGYKAGDYKQFFNDPRTRAEYLKWAPLMLAAEDYLAGKVALGKSSK